MRDKKRSAYTMTRAGFNIDDECDMHTGDLGNFESQTVTFVVSDKAGIVL